MAEWGPWILIGLLALGAGVLWWQGKRDAARAMREANRRRVVEARNAERDIRDSLQDKDPGEVARLFDEARRR